MGGNILKMTEENHFTTSGVSKFPDEGDAEFTPRPPKKTNKKEPACLVWINCPHCKEGIVMEVFGARANPQ